MGLCYWRARDPDDLWFQGEVITWTSCMACGAGEGEPCHDDGRRRRLVHGMRSALYDHIVRPWS